MTLDEYKAATVIKMGINPISNKRLWSVNKSKKPVQESSSLSFVEYVRF